MPTRAKAEVEPLELSPAPAHSAELCEDCGQFELHPSTTSYTCEHGSWKFAPAVAEAEPAPVSDEDRLAAVLGSLSTEQLQALLAAKAEG